MLHLIIQYELGNDRCLKQQIEKCKKQLTTEGRLKPFEFSFLQMFGQLTSERFKDHKAKVFERFRDRLSQAITRQGLEKNFNYQFFYSWVEKHINLVV